MKRKTGVVLLIALLVALFMYQSISTTSKSKTSPLPVAETQRQAYKQEIIRLINSERAKKGLAPLKTDSQLLRLTTIKSEDMRDNGYFATSSPRYGSMTEMLKANNYRYRIALEKLSGGHATPQETFNSWMESSDFVSSITKDNLTHLGVGFADGKGEYFYYWTLWLVEKPTPVDAGTQSSFESEVLRLVNIERTSKGLQPLKWHSGLAGVAQAKSENMRDKNYFDHQSPTYGDLKGMLSHFKVSYSSAAENIAAGQKTPKDVVHSWMNSEGHRKNILDPDFTHLGVGYADGGGDYYTYWTQLFVRK